MARGDTKVKDRSGDRKYFVQTPMLVWALTQDPYELALWFVIKMVAWEDDECTLSTEDLATLSMMSTGKVSQCRARLMELGLIEGELRKDPDYPQSVWHLSIPDVWRVSLEWAEKHTTMRSKVDHKTLIRAERDERLAAVRSLHRAKAEAKEPSPGEDGIPPGEDGIPPGEDGIPPGEDGIPPGETTNIYIDSVDSLDVFKKNSARVSSTRDRSTTQAEPPPTHALAIADAETESFDGPADATPKAKATAKPARRAATHRYYDPRKLVAGFIPADKGETAVEIYFERFSPTEHKLTAPRQDDIVKVAKDLDRWRSVVIAWSQTPYSPANLKGMFDWYRDGVPNGTRSNGHVSNGATNGTTKEPTPQGAGDYEWYSQYGTNTPVV